ncbi:prepilin-type N-terminal cleavage/methylation domain-containing protein [bacterium]|nr:prepilin-type N-terminal cleavage/methylation domain-containing protein [bacterium]
MPWLRKNRPRGVTLIELIVVSAILSVVLGLVFGIFMRTRTATLRGQEELAMETQARLVADQITSILQSATPPSALDGAVPPPEFRPDACRIVSTRDSDGGLFQVWTISNVKAEDDGSRHQRVRLAAKPLDSEGSAQEQMAGLQDDRFSTSVFFQYTSRHSLRVDDYQTQLPADQYPLLIRVRVRVKKVQPSTGGESREYELVTSLRML